jgi:DNA repair protein SbcC/Rad50
LNGSLTNLTEISTGQRSALGLSMFLAQNMKLRFAPPVILIDDPIANVDDLNCLSFFDYLREIALTERRQIFFSTANDKLAAMFERKFDFLGFQGFKKITLHRESTPLLYAS